MGRILLKGGALLVLLTSTLLSTGAAERPDTNSLKGLVGVDVLVESISDELENDGLFTSSIETAVELRLRQNGIRVFTQEENEATLGAPYLYVRVSAFKHREMPLYSYSAMIELHQLVLLARDPKMLQFAATWESKSTIGTVGAGKVVQIKGDVLEQLDEFINAWLTVNPR